MNQCRQSGVRTDCITETTQASQRLEDPVSASTWAILALFVFTILPLQTYAIEPLLQDISMEQLLSSGREFQGLPAPKASVSKSSSTSIRTDNRISADQSERHIGKDKFPTHALPPLPLGRIVDSPAPYRPMQKTKSDPTSEIARLVDQSPLENAADLPTIFRIIELGSVTLSKRLPKQSIEPSVRAKALLCIDCSSNEVLLDKNSQQPLPIASITKLVTAMVVIDQMDLDQVCEAPKDIRKIEKHVVGIRPGERIRVRDLLHGLLIESGNDCAEMLARFYPKGGRLGFLAAMKKKAQEIGATKTQFYTPSGLDIKSPARNSDTDGRFARLSNTASAQDVALIARRAFAYPLIRQIARMKTYTFRTLNANSREYHLVSNDKLLERDLPVEGAKTGYTDAAGKCIVALFNDKGKERLVVVLNTHRHFSAAEKIYRWASQQ